MKDGVCPKCGSTNIHTSLGMPNKAVGYGTGHTIVIEGKFIGPNLVHLDDYVCTDCGYVESYIQDAEKLQAIRDLWSRVGDEKQKRKNDET